MRSRIQSFRHAIDGLRYLIQSQHNAWIHITATGTVCLLGLMVDLSIVEWSMLVLSMGLVWSAEAFNTALEAVIDKVSPEFHPLAKRAKDTAAASVLLAAIAAAIVGLAILGPKLWDLGTTLAF
ncbi:MAG: diacylglycerol kinase family protein [Bacteroidota bacterium]